MKLCFAMHTTIVYDDLNCPLCLMIVRVEELEAALETLRDDYKDLERASS